VQDVLGRGLAADPLGEGDVLGDPGVEVVTDHDMSSATVIVLMV